MGGSRTHYGDNAGEFTARFPCRMEATPQLWSRGWDLNPDSHTTEGVVTLPLSYPGTNSDSRSFRFGCCFRLGFLCGGEVEFTLVYGGPDSFLREVAR